MSVLIFYQELELGAFDVANGVRDHSFFDCSVVGIVAVGVTNVGGVEPAGTCETGDVTGEVQDVTKVGVVGVTIVDADGEGRTITGEVSGNCGVGTTPDGAVAVDHSADEAVGGVGTGIGGAVTIAQSNGSGSGAGNG